MAKSLLGTNEGCCTARTRNAAIHVFIPLLSLLTNFILLSPSTTLIYAFQHVHGSGCYHANRYSYGVSSCTFGFYLCYGGHLAYVFSISIAILLKALRKAASRTMKVSNLSRNLWTMLLIILSSNSRDSPVNMSPILSGYTSRSTLYPQSSWSSPRNILSINLEKVTWRKWGENRGGGGD